MTCRDRLENAREDVLDPGNAGKLADRPGLDVGFCAGVCEEPELGEGARRTNVTAGSLRDAGPAPPPQLGRVPQSFGHGVRRDESACLDCCGWKTGLLALTQSRQVANLTQPGSKFRLILPDA